MRPGAHMRCDVAQHGPGGPVDGKTGAEDQEVQLDGPGAGADLQGAALLPRTLHRAAQVEEGVRVARDTQRAEVRRRYLLRVDVVADAPLVRVRQAGVAVHEARAAGPLTLVDTRQVGPAHEQVDAGRAVLQGLGRAVHGRGASAHHAHPQATQGLVVQFVGRVGPSAARQLVRPRRHRAGTQSGPARGQHQAPGKGPQWLTPVLKLQFHQTVCTRVHVRHPVFVMDLQVQHPAVPAQVVHPLQAVDLVQRLPGRGAELRLEPSPEGQRGQAQRRPGQLLGRAQRFHARRGGPGAFKTGRRLVVQGHGHATVLQSSGQRQPGHAGPDDGHIGHGLAFMRAGWRPARGRLLQTRHLVGQALLQRCQSWRLGSCLPLLGACQ